VHPDKASPILPHPKLFTNTLPLPDAIGAACAGHGLPGNKCTVLTSLSLLIGILLAKTFPEPVALTIPEQWAISASPILVTAGIINSLYNYSLFESNIGVYDSIVQFHHVALLYGGRLVFLVQTLSHDQICQGCPRTYYR
jgi:hypothetical protein